MFVSIGEAAAVLGVHTGTLRRWERCGKINCAKRTPGGHRRYDLRMLLSDLGLHDHEGAEKLHVAYARVSSHGQKEDLKRQEEVLSNHLFESSHRSLLISDLGSGISFRKRGLKKLLRLVMTGQVSQITVTHRDRLVRFGFELIEFICAHFGVKINILFEEKALDDNVKLSHDLVEIITVFSSKIYGRRSHKNRNKVQAQTQAA